MQQMTQILQLVQEGRQAELNQLLHNIQNWWLAAKKVKDD